MSLLIELANRIQDNFQIEQCSGSTEANTNHRIQQEPSPYSFSIEEILLQAHLQTWAMEVEGL